MLVHIFKRYNEVNYLKITQMNRLLAHTAATENGSPIFTKSINFTE